ncbi:SagB family peptide dehydrogenase [Albimonas pacifica]|uniref:SagB-type dehydrogenase domain-containing protein n=1 Tax=Albimonas pacifica TaxID=1114924 RepID=A0A1I3BEV9_9RHOB|nr:SagB family peptide dehydrogenase [Albimonas pacifica]SFH60489.1 SagB-type dehydrogenase domain-containing protein [Albimonas pacifica]
MSGDAPGPPRGETLRLVPAAAGGEAEAPGPRPESDPESWSLHLGLHPRVTAAQALPGALRLTLVETRETRLPWEAPALGRALAALARGGLAWAQLSALCQGVDGAPDAPPADPADTARLAEEARALLARLRAEGLLTWWLGAPGLRAATFEPLRLGYLPLDPTPPSLSLRLPPGTVAARGPRETILEIPDLDALVTLGPEGLPLLGALLGHGHAGAPPMPAMARGVFAAAGVLRPPPVPGSAEAAADAGWTAWDRLGHRLTRNVHRLHAPVPGGPERPPLPAPPPAWARSDLARVTLPRPAPDAPSRPLAAVLESRRSRREPGARPLEVGAVATLLWRIARRRAEREAAGLGGHSRNLPAGGAKGDVSLYLAVGRCLGLPRGFYGYDDLAHALTRFPDPSVAGGDPLQAVLDQTREAMQARATPDAVVVLAWRPGALAPRYAFNAYRLGLMHAGVGMLALSLAAEDLGLAGCPVGLGDQRHFALLTGCDPRIETSLAEFALSGRDDAAAAPGPAAPPGA